MTELSGLTSKSALTFPVRCITRPTKTRSNAPAITAISTPTTEKFLPVHRLARYRILRSSSVPVPFSCGNPNMPYLNMPPLSSSNRQAPPSKTNTLSLGIISVLILVLVMQIWLLTAALNESLDGNNAVKWPAFAASVALFLAGAALLRYLPDPVRRANKAERHRRTTAGL